MNRPLLITAFIVIAKWSWLCSGQVSCNGILSGAITSSVTCTGDCILDGADIGGNVECSTGSLVAKGNTLITGNILASASITRVELNAVTVLGAVTVSGASVLSEVVITQEANLGSVTIENTPGDTIVAGTLTSLELNGSGDLFANSLSTISTVTVRGGNGAVEFCDSQVGGLLLEERIGNVEINANNVNCPPTILTGGLTATKGNGRVRVISASLSSGDFIISEHSGDVTLQEAQVSDIKVTDSTGFLTIANVDTDSDTSISLLEGDVVLKRVNIDGDVLLEKNDGFLMVSDLRSTGDMTITEQEGDVELLEFNLSGDLSISGVSGSVTLRDSNFLLDGVSVVLVSGDLSIQDVNLNGDLTINEVSGNMIIEDSNFTLQFVSIALIGDDLTIQNLLLDGNVAISLVSGNVLLKDSKLLNVQNNVEVNVQVQEISGMVQIIDNVINGGRVDKNTGGVKLCRNVFIESLSCVDNMPAPFGSDNIIPSGTGQCATGL